MRSLCGQDEIAFHAPAPGMGPHGRLARLAADLDHAPPDLAALDLAAWEALLLDLRAALIGPRIDAEAHCEACGTGNALIFPAADLPRAPGDPPVLDGRALSLTLGDLLAHEARGLTGEAALTALLAAAMGLTPDAAAQRLARPDRGRVVAALESAASGLGLEIASTCTACGAALVLPLDVATYLDAELQSRAARLLDEVHLIALTYHWSQAEILSLPLARRQDYLRRIMASRTLGDVATGWPGIGGM